MGIVPALISPLGRLDARFRVVALFTLMLATGSVRSWSASAVGLGIALALAMLARLSPRHLGHTLLAVGIGVLPLVLLLPLTGQPTHWFGFSPELIGPAIALGLRALALGVFGRVLLDAGPLPETLAALQALGVPGLLVQLLQLSHRYVGVLQEEFARLRLALRTRGFRNRADAHSYRTIGNVAGALLVRGHDRAEDVAVAMRCRAFAGHYRTLGQFRATARDWFGGLLLLLLAAALLLGES